jgi:hypothetical protein
VRILAKREGGQTDWGDFPFELAASWGVHPAHECQVPGVSIEPAGRYAGITQVVMEDFVIYPPDVSSGPPPPWDQVITARLIGAIQVLADLADIPVEYQGAQIKSDALKAAAREDFSTPLYENRHENDATMHATYWLSRRYNAAIEGKAQPFAGKLLAIDPGETVGWAIYA